MLNTSMTKGVLRPTTHQAAAAIDIGESGSGRDHCQRQRILKPSRSMWLLSKCSGISILSGSSGMNSGSPSATVSEESASSNPAQPQVIRHLLCPPLRIHPFWWVSAATNHPSGSDLSHHFIIVTIAQNSFPKDL